MFGLLIPGKPVQTDFEQVNDTEMRMYIPQINELTSVTVFIIDAPEPPEDFAYSIFIQQSTNDPIYLGQITKTLFSISHTVSQYITEKGIESAGYIEIVIEPVQEIQPDQITDQDKLALIGKLMTDDLYNFISSHDDVAYEGDHYVDYEAVEKWTNLVEERIKLNQKFWNKVQ